MSSDLSMLSDDAPLGHNGAPRPHTNGHVNGNRKAYADSPMSEDDSDDDVPLLVRAPAFMTRV